MNNKVIAYHENCKDGFCAMCIALQKHHNDPTIPLIPVQYGQEADILANPVFKNKDVYFVDFGLKKHHMDIFSGIVNSVTMLDHHDTILQDYVDDVVPGHNGFLIGKYKNANLVMDMHRSGALIAWDYFFEKPAPDMVNYISDDDIYSFLYDNTRPFISRLTAQPMSIEYWQQILNAPTSTIDAMVKEGMLLEEQYITLCKAFLHSMQPITIKINDEEHHGHAVLCGGDRGFKSRIAELMYQQNGTFAAVIGTFGEQYNISLRAANESNKMGITPYNVKHIAQYFGGGGHIAAAGCALTKEQFEQHIIVHPNPKLINRP